MEEENVIDSKIKQELECLNTTSLKINDLENEINEKRSQYRTALASSTQRLNAIAQKLGDCISKARPYYEAKRIAKQAHNEAQQAAIHFERAASMHTAAREMVTVAEKGMVSDSQDAAWAEMLNHAIARVNEAESERFRSEAEHQKRANAFKNAEEKVKKLQKSLKSSIKKSQPYFEMKKHTQLTLETITGSVNEVEEELKKLKQLYSTTLQNLEEISDSIHAARALSSFRDEQSTMLLGQRQDGVGAETTFNEEDIITDLSLKLEKSSNQLSVLNDLRESDSVDQLSSLNESLSVDVISYSSSISQSSSVGMSSHSDNTNPGTERFVSARAKDLSEATLSGTSVTGTLSSESVISDHSSLTDYCNISKKETPPSGLQKIEAINDAGVNHACNENFSSFSHASNIQSMNAYPVTATVKSPSEKKRELLLSVAGLGEVSSSQ